MIHNKFQNIKNLNMRYLYFILLLMCPAVCCCQTITGTVKNPNHDPLDGITVTIKGTTIKTATDVRGEFKLTVDNVNAILVFTAANMEAFECPLTGKKKLTIVLKPRVNTLDEVQVIAYGTNTQRNTVGSISKVTSEAISEQPVTNPLAALEGRVPGLVVTPPSGLPGASFNVQIRGQNTLNPTLAATVPLNEPLFIVDGVPFAPQNGNINQFRSLASPGDAVTYNDKYGGMSPFNSINPADIESIEVLRDADATAIYGSRGGNGVILITTKKGKAGKTEFTLNLIDGESMIGHTMPMMNITQYLAMRRQAFANDGLTPDNIVYDDAYAPDLTVFDTTRYTDWKKYFFGHTAHNLDLNSSLSGGDANTQFRLGTGFNRDSYIFPGDYADYRASFSASIHHNSLNKKFTVDFTSGYSYDKNNSAGDPSVLTAYTLEPDYPSLLDNKGNLVWTYKGAPLDGSYAAYNPLAYLKELYSIQNISLNSNVLVGYKITDGLTVRTNLGYSTYNSKEYYGDPLSAQNPEFSPVATASFGNNDFMTWIIEPQAEYKSKFKQLSYNILLGSTFQKTSNSSSQITGSGYINDDLIHSISAAPVQNATDSYSDYKYDAVFARMNLNWDAKYLLSLTANRDGSSRFGPDKQFGDFWSVGGGWLFNEEPFIKNNFGFLSYGKLRGSYGTTGNDGIADYQYLSRWLPTTYTYGGSFGYTPQNLYNPDFTWATTKKLEFGLELGFLKDRLLFNATWFRSRSGDQLITYNLPSQTGFNNVLENWNAVVQNTGIELSVQSSIVRSGGFTWTSSFNMTLPNNKLVSFPGLAQSSYAVKYQEGQPLGTIYGFRYAGVNPSTGLFQFYNSKGQVTETPFAPGSGSFNDFVKIGSLDPKFYGGWQNTFRYKEIQLDLFFEYRKQLGINYLGQVYNYLPGNEFNQPVAVSNAWSKPGQVTNLQVYSSQYGQAATAASDFIRSTGAYSDASYIRFKTISLSYNLPPAITRRYNIQNARLYLTAQNLFTITGYKGNDPETQSFYGVPPLKTISCGLQLTF